MREWTDKTAKGLCWATAVLIALCLGVAALRLLEYRGIWRVPEKLGPYAGIGSWVVLALGILFAMDRGIPKEGRWGPRLLWLRRALLVSAFAAVVSLVMLK